MLQQWPAQDQPPAANSQPTAAASEKVITAYTLPPDLYKKAHDRGHMNFHLALIGFAYGLVVLWLILRWSWRRTYRDWAEGASSHGVLCRAWSSAALVADHRSSHPASGYLRRDGRETLWISVQGWGSWSWDWIKGRLIGLVIGTILIWLLYMVLRRTPGRAWFYFWLIARAHRRVHFLHWTLGDRPDVSQVRTTATESSGR